MEAVIYKQNKKGTVQYCGEIVQNGMMNITIAIIDKKGSKRLKSFNKSNITYKIIDKSLG